MLIKEQEQAKLNMEILFNSRTENAWLSNFHLIDISIDGIKYPSVENSYQAHKTIDVNIRKEFATISPKDAKYKGQNLIIRNDWEDVKQTIMRKGLNLKFENKELLQLLLNTTGSQLIHLSPWDLYWGVDNNGNGQNILGKMIMEIRSFYNMDGML